MHIFFVAFLPNLLNSADHPIFPGASKKIEFLLSTLANDGHRITLINSSEVYSSKLEFVNTQISISSENRWLESFHIAAASKTKFSRLRSIFKSPDLFDFVVKKRGKPDVLWCYNAYAFEMRLSCYSYHKYLVPSILEFEDWHFSRTSFLRIRPKLLLDYALWKLAVQTGAIKYCFAVNSYLESLMTRQGVPTKLLPGVVKESLCNPCHSAYISGCPTAVNCGYFGGLTEEKGALFVGELIEYFMSESVSVKWHIAGTGELDKIFVDLSRRYSQNVCYYGYLSDEEYEKVLSTVDVVLNPHKRMPGVFPFKIVESVAAGKLVISTPLDIPRSLQWMRSSLIQRKLDISLWSKEILSANIYKSQNRSLMQLSRSQALSMYSRSGVSRMVSKSLAYVCG